MSTQTKTAPPKSPSIARDLLVLGDVYFTLGWLAFQRLRYGPLWPWDQRSNHLPADRQGNGAVHTPLRRR